MTECCRFRVEGRVQGVFFRASTRTAARRLGVTGWVANRCDGDVEGVACGDPRALALFRDWLQRGPPQARVDRVDIQAEPRAHALDFEIR